MTGIARPDYAGGSIVNLVSSIAAALGCPSDLYPPLAVLPPARLQRSRSIVLLVIDGLGYHYLTRRGRESRLHRHLAARITSVFPPTTATAIPAFFTGVAPQQHGFTGWFTYFKELAGILAVLPLRPRGAAGPVALDPLALSGVAPLSQRLDACCQVVMPDWIARSGFNRAYSGIATIHAYRTLQQFFECLEAALQAPGRRNFVYAYWPDFDSLSHQFGVGSRQVSQHFTELDQAFAAFLGRASGSGCTLLVTADHGFVDTDPHHEIRLEEHPDLADALVLPLSGEPRTAYCYVRPEAADRFERYVRLQLGHAARVVPSRRLLADGYFGRGPVHPRLWQRVGDYTLMMRDRYVIRDWILGERPFEQIGVHGGDSEDEMYVPLICLDL
jgi:predicted AlkP superfamily pyrophosphatase or phosphodiesterase